MSVHSTHHRGSAHRAAYPVPTPGASQECWGLAGRTRVAEATTPWHPAVRTQPHALLTRWPRLRLETQLRLSSQGRRCMHDFREPGSQHSFFPSIPWSPGVSPCPLWVWPPEHPPSSSWGAAHTVKGDAALAPMAGGAHSPEAPVRCPLPPGRCFPTRLLAFLQIGCPCCCL